MIDEEEELRDDVRRVEEEEKAVSIPSSGSRSFLSTDDPY